MPDQDEEFDELAERITAVDHELAPAADIATGADAAARGRELMVREFGGEVELDAELRRAGRPRLGESARGKSPVVRGSVAAADRAQFDRLMQETGKKESELVREAVHLLLDRYRAAS
jgi:hypothetical protein